MEERAAARIRDRLAARRGEMEELLGALVEAESPSSDPAAQERPFALLGKALESCGFRLRRLPGRATGGCLLARPAAARRAAPRQLLVGHVDTVWPLGTLRQMPLRVTRRRLYGPGAFDMKGGLVQMVFALGALAEADLEPAVTPVVLINSDEEIGSPESDRHLCRLARGADRALVLEPSLGPSGRLKTARKAVGQFTVLVRGRASHAGLDPERGASAILELSRVVQELFALNDPGRGVTVNVGTIEGGIRPNVVAAESRASVDVRVPDDGVAQEVTEAIHRLEARTRGTVLEVEGGFDRPAMVPGPGSRELWRRAREAAAALGVELGEATAGGASDGNATSVYTPTLDGLGAVGGGAHAVGEHVRLEAMVERAALLALLLLGPALGSPRPEE